MGFLSVGIIAEMHKVDVIRRSDVYAKPESLATFKGARKTNGKDDDVGKRKNRIFNVQNRDKPQASGEITTGSKGNLRRRIEDFQLNMVAYNCALTARNYDSKHLTIIMITNGTILYITLKISASNLRGVLE